MAVLFSPWGNSQFLTSSGAPANGWKIYAYVAGSSTPLATYTDSTGAVAQSNPIIINSLGFPTTGQIWLTSGLMYKLVLTDSSDIVQKTEDNISGVLSSSSSSLSQWVASGLTPTYVSATSFTLSGDQTSAFHVGRRLQTTNTSGTIYSRITASAYTTLTTVTVVNDSGVLDSGLSSVNYGLLTAVNPSTAGAASPVLPRIDVASVAGTVDLTGNATIDDIRITGTNAITAFTVATGRVLRVTAGGAFTLTNNGSIVTQIGANITCSAGDTFILRATAANVVEVMNYVSVVPSGAQIQNVTAVASSNTMIVTLGATTLDFRNTNLTIGTPNRRTLGTASNITIPQGATLGVTSGNTTRIMVGGIDNAGTIEPFVGGMTVDLNEGQLINTTAISNAANSSNVFYTTIARTNVPFRVLGYLDSNQSTAGTYASQPLTVQGLGGNIVMQGLTSNSAVTNDTALSIGQQVYIDVSAATSVALKIATADNQLYELSMEIQGSATGSAGTCFLNPNNTTYTNFFRFDVTATSGAAVSAGGGYQSAFVLAYNQEVRGADCKISTKTISKWVRGSAYGLVNSPTSYMSMQATHWQAAASSVGAGDTTTLWTSLGTVVFPVAATGRIYVRRLA